MKVFEKIKKAVFFFLFKKAFEVVWCALRKTRLDECLVQLIMKLYNGSSTRIKGVESEESIVNVSVHQGSMLSTPFILVLQVLLRDFKTAFLSLLMFVNYLVGELL